MFNNMENPKIISAFFNPSNIHVFFKSRPSHGILLRVCNTTEYTFQSGTFCHGENQLLFIPQGESFWVKGEETGQYAVVNFTATIPNAVPRLYDLDGTQRVKDIFNELIRAYLVPGSSMKFEKLSLFYKLLSIMTTSEERNPSDVQNRIRPAIQFLEEHIFDPALRIENLHDLCNMSAVSFRKSFHMEYGTSPKKYVTNLRLTQAKRILESGEYAYIYEIASAVGYDDALYFSKLFSQKFGYSPKRHNSQ